METKPASPTPAISVIIPAYNTAHLIAACLDSVFAQTWQDFEVIVVNDGSPDTAELDRTLQPYLPRIIYIRQENKRAAGARNTAIRRAQGEFLAFLDSDDRWLPDHLALQMDLFASDPELDMAYSNALVVGNPARIREFMDKCPSQGEPTFEALVVERCQVSLATVVAKKGSVIGAGLFDETLPRCDDYDLWLRMAFHGAKITYRREIQAHLNGGRPGSLGQFRVKMAEAYIRILEKLDSCLPLDDSQRRVVRQRIQEIRARYLLECGKAALSERRFSEARDLLAEANRHFRKPGLGAAVLGLRVAPSIAGRLISMRG